MITFDKSEILALLSSVITMVTVLSTFLFIYTRRNQTKYDEEKNRIELEAMRKSIETRMYELNERLVATQDRWVDANHLLISSQNKGADIEGGRDKLTQQVAKAMGVTIDNLNIKTDLVFVLTPFHPKFKRQFEIIAQSCSQLGLVAMRGDEQFIVDDVLDHIIRQIAQSRIVIANVDGRNPNVFYELGVAHAMGKPTILIAPRPEDVPFDLRAKRLVLFESDEDLSQKLRDELARVIIKHGAARPS